MPCCAVVRAVVWIAVSGGMEAGRCLVVRPEGRRGKLFPIRVEDLSCWFLPSSVYVEDLLGWNFFPLLPLPGSKGERSGKGRIQVKNGLLFFLVFLRYCQLVA